MDTFGNTGDLRIPAQHTAPGTFVNSSGQGLNRLHASQTGGPSMQQQQPNQTGFGNPPQHQQNPMMPAQTGPAGMGMNGFGGGGFGQASNNPFGGAQQQQQQHQRPAPPQQSGSLIDL
ncbi:MAG: hypothetical protein Q9204_009452 [Flavoplaca sp. TL-2023a]